MGGSFLCFVNFLYTFCTKNKTLDNRFCICYNEIPKIYKEDFQNENIAHSFMYVSFAFCRFDTCCMWRLEHLPHRARIPRTGGERGIFCRRSRLLTRNAVLVLL